MVVNHFVLCWASGCESWCAMLRAGIHDVLCLAIGFESWYVMLSQWLCIMVCYSEPVIVNQGMLYWAQWLWIMLFYILCQWSWISVLYWTIGCDSWWAMLGQWLWIICVMLSQWLWIIVCFGEPVVNHGELCWDSGCESWWAMLRHWVWIMLCYAWAELVNHGELWWATGCI